MYRSRETVYAGRTLDIKYTDEIATVYITLARLTFRRRRVRRAKKHDFVGLYFHRNFDGSVSKSVEGNLFPGEIRYTSSSKGFRKKSPWDPDPALSSKIASQSIYPFSGICAPLARDCIKKVDGIRSQ